MGMIFFFVNAAMTYRVLPFGHDINKVLHICFHTAAVVCVSFGLYAVFRSNNKYPYDTYTDDGTKKDVYYSNLYSSHSFVGISAIVLFYQNYILGLVIFFIGSPELKRNYLSNHIKLGMLAMITALAAVEAGVMELATEYSCGYQSYNPDYNPAANYHKESAGCKNLNGIAITVLITVLCAVFTLVDTPEPTTSANEKLLSP
jgi:cytochrome b-561